ncbi:hypothetical protein BgiBS90_000724, partial [Biomphalaria glabrata]
MMEHSKKLMFVKFNESSSGRSSRRRVSGEPGIGEMGGGQIKEQEREEVEKCVGDMGEERVKK